MVLIAYIYIFITENECLLAFTCVPSSKPLGGRLHSDNLSNATWRADGLLGTGVSVKLAHIFGNSRGTWGGANSTVAVVTP